MLCYAYAVLCYAMLCYAVLYIGIQDGAFLSNFGTNISTYFLSPQPACLAHLILSNFAI